MVSITKDRNLIRISLSAEQPRPYTLDINTGVFLSQKGLPMKSSPPRLRDCFRNEAFINRDPSNANIAKFLYYFLYEWNFNIINLAFQPLHLKILQFCERLQTVSYEVTNYDLRWLASYYNEIEDRDLASIAEYRQRNPLGNLEGWYNYTAYSHWCKKYNLVSDEHFTEEMLRAMYEHRTPLIQKNASRTAYYLSKGLYDFFQFANLSMSHCFRFMNDYYRICKIMETTPAKGDFFRNYVEAKRTYELRQEEFDDKAIEVFQQGRMSALSFEDEKCQVIVPLTAKEIIDEGEAQRNCVGRLYLPHVKQHETHIVFIRLKSNLRHSYITCEVSPEGRIMQYLAFANSTPDQLGLDFRKKYQNHLDAHWNRD